MRQAAPRERDATGERSVSLAKMRVLHPTACVPAFAPSSAKIDLAPLDSIHRRGTLETVANSVSPEALPSAKVGRSPLNRARSLPRKAQLPHRNSRQ
jgi:hypothetical protein